MYVSMHGGLGQQGQRAANCWQFEKDPLRFSTFIAQVYGHRELGLEFGPGGLGPEAAAARCIPGRRMCEVSFPGNIVVWVLPAQPNHVIVQQMVFKGSGPARGPAPRRLYEYRCTSLDPRRTELRVITPRVHLPPVTRQRQETLPP